MVPLLVAFAALSCVVLGITIGLALRTVLPETHWKDDSRDILKTSSGLIATLVALVLGLLVASAKGTFDAAGSSIMQTGARFIALDRYLQDFGSEAEPIRVGLKRALRHGIERMWPRQGHGDPDSYPMAHELDDVYKAIVRLDPPTDAARKIQAQCVQVANDLLLTRWQLVEQTQYELPRVFLVVLIFWLMVLFMVFGLLTPRNLTTVLALFVCAVSVSAAIFLILELTHPFDGTIVVSSLPFEKALALMDTH